MLANDAQAFKHFCYSQFWIKEGIDVIKRPNATNKRKQQQWYRRVSKGCQENILQTEWNSKAPAISFWNFDCRLIAIDCSCLVMCMLFLLNQFDLNLSPPGLFCWSEAHTARRICWWVSFFHSERYEQHLTRGGAHDQAIMASLVASRTCALRVSLTSEIGNYLLGETGASFWRTFPFLFCFDLCLLLTLSALATR